MNTLYWPAGPPRYTHWHKYIPRGFESLGYNIVYLDELHEDSLMGGTYYFGVEHDGKTEYAWYDFRDFVAVPTEFLDKHDKKMFKIMLLAEDETDLIRPIGQITSKSMPEPVDREEHIDVMLMGRAWVEDCNRIKACRIISKMGLTTKFMLNSMNSQIAAHNPFEANTVNHAAYVRAIQASKICLAIQGGHDNKGDWTFRHTEILSQSQFLLMPEPRCVIPGDSDSLVAMGYFKRDMSYLEEQVKLWLEHDTGRNAVARAGRKYYDNYLSPTGQAQYIIGELFDAEKTETDEHPTTNGTDAGGSCSDNSEEHIGEPGDRSEPEEHETAI